MRSVHKYPVYLELVRQEKLTNTYRCQIVAKIVTEHLIGEIVDNELRAVVQARPAGQARNGSKELPGRMSRSFTGFDW